MVLGLATNWAPLFILHIHIIIAALIAILFVEKNIYSLYTMYQEAWHKDIDEYVYTHVSVHNIHCVCVHI